ncbi:MAG: calcium/sodium antiporter [Rhodobacteraceae bacterium]|nr:calcium/sodium antiporter [Paracoccaceae bacterium]
MDWLMVLAGLVMLLIAGDALVKGAVNLSLRLGVPALIVSLTVVAFGTSAPELLVSVSAIRDGAPGIALGNVVGSNIANVLLVLGVPALFTTLYTSKCDTRSSYLQMIAATLLFMALACRGVIDWKSGIVLLVALAAMLAMAAHQTMKHRRNCRANEGDEDVEGADPSLPVWKITAYLVSGMIFLPLGAELLVKGAVSIAREFGMSETVIGLTLVAVGTSLPELATTVSAALRRQADVAVGNVIGSNMFNLLGIMGVASFFGTIPVGDEFLSFGFWVMLGSSLLLIPFVFMKRDITRPIGAALTIGYVAVTLMLIY